MQGGPEEAVRVFRRLRVPVAEGPSGAGEAGGTRYSTEVLMHRN